MDALGSGVPHIGRPPEYLVLSGRLFHGIQLWVNLPAERKWVQPSCTVGAQGRPVSTGPPALLRPGDIVPVGVRCGRRRGARRWTPSGAGRPRARRRTGPAKIAWDGSFVMNTQAEARPAFEDLQDFQAGRLGTRPGCTVPSAGPGGAAAGPGGGGSAA